MKNINIGLTLFLFNYSDRKLHGIFEAASPGQLNINPYAWTSDGTESTPYAAQVQELIIHVLVYGVVTVSNSKLLTLMWSLSCKGKDPSAEVVPSLD